MGFFDWFRTQALIPEALWQENRADLPFLAALDAEEDKNLRRLAERFLAEKEFTTSGGLELTDAMCVSIAAQGCLPILRLGLEAYRGWVGIIVYPDEFLIRRSVEDESGVVHEYNEQASGEAWAGGPLIVSWRDAQMAGKSENAGYNVVIHEFAHKLDMLNGESDGMPALHSGLTPQDWRRVLLGAYGDFCRRLDHGEETRIDPYAAEHPSEFFAVVSESFFEIPQAVAEAYPALYALLVRYYRQDPLARQNRIQGRRPPTLHCKVP